MDVEWWPDWIYHKWHTTTVEKGQHTSFIMGNAKNHSVPAAWYLGSWFDSRISKSKHNLRFVNFLIVRRTTHQEKSFIKVNRDSFMRSYPVDFAVVTAYYKACLTAQWIAYNVYRMFAYLLNWLCRLQWNKWKLIIQLILPCLLTRSNRLRSSIGRHINRTQSTIPHWTKNGIAQICAL